MRIKVELSGEGYRQTTNVLCAVGDTFGVLKQKLRELIPQVPADITLYFDNATVHDNHTLVSYGVKEGDLLKDNAQVPSAGPGAGASTAPAIQTVVVTEMAESVLQSFADAVRGVLKEDELNETALSKMSLTKANKIFEIVGLIPVEEELDETIPSRKFVPFKWQHEKEDDDMSIAIHKHLRTQLQAHNLIGRNKLEIHDVHNNKQLFSVQIGRYLLAGGADAVIVPHKVPNYSCTQALRVVIDWKAPPYIGFEAVRAQAFGELIAAAISKHPVLVVVTDLATKTHLFQLTGSKVKIYRDLPAQRGFDYIVSYLNACSQNIEFDMATDKLTDVLLDSVQAAKKVKEHFAVHPLMSQLDSAIDFDAPSWERYDTALHIMKSWSDNLMYS